MEPTSVASQKLKDINMKRVAKEKHGVSTESSRTSLSSSSCSSTFSSVECNRTADSELSSSGHCLPPQSPSTSIPTKQLKPSVGNKQQASGYHDIVKDSTYEEAQGLSLKIERKHPRPGHGMKHIDSPRPLHLSKSVKLTSPGSNGLCQDLPNLGEAPMSFNRQKDGSRLQILKDRPRFSYDGRESRETLKYCMQFKEIPRLSLDSREPSTRTFTRELKTDYVSNNLPRGMGGSTINIRNLQQEQESNKRPSIVVAKLMGLETFPVSMSEGHMKPIKTCIGENSQSLSTPRTGDAERQNPVASSPRNNFKEPTSPQLRNSGAHLKPISSSRPPLETAPWRQDVNQGSQIQASMSWRSPKELKSSHTVYGEIEMRLDELQFKKSGKGLRALKHIIETMQKTKEKPEEKKDEKGSGFVSPTTYNNPTSISVYQRKEKRNPQSSHRIPYRTRLTSPPKTTAIARPCNGTGKLDNQSPRLIRVGSSGLPKLQTGVSGTVRKDFQDKQTAKSQSPSRNNLRDFSSNPTLSMDNDTGVGTPRSTNASKVPHHLIREKITNSYSSGTLSPRLQQKQHGQVKVSHSTAQSAEELSQTLRGSNRQMKGSGSPGRTFRTRTYNLRGGEDESSETNSKTRNFSHQSDMISLQCERNSGLASKTDTEVTSTSQSDETSSTFHPGVHKNTEARLSGDQTMPNLSISIPEQPSPVSVLDSAYYRDDSPSPVKKTSNAFQDDEAPSSDETYWKPLDQDHLPKSTTNTESPSLRSNQKKPEFMAHMFQNMNPDHKYIYEILASGVLHRDLHPHSKATEAHSSSHTLNTSSFPFFEKTKTGSRLSNGKNNSIKIAQKNVNEKIHKKLVFDTVDEILASKMALSGFHEPWSPSTIFPRRCASGQELLIEVFSQLEKLQRYSTDNEYEALEGIIWENSARQNGYHDEKRGIVLDVERLIFKDLVVEIICGKEALPHA